MKELFSFVKNKKRKKVDMIKKIINDLDKGSLIRLHYISIVKFMGRYDDLIKYGKTEDLYQPVKLPNGMTNEDAYKVISYLSEKVEKENNLEPASEKSVGMVDALLSMYGFERAKGCGREGHYHSVALQPPRECNTIEGVTDLFTVGGHFSLFHKTKTYKKYFDWFTAGVTEKEINDIYNNLGMNLALMLSEDYKRCHKNNCEEEMQK